MTVRETRRAAAIEAMADFVLKEGLARATLRNLATAAGASDRMLLYYFADKDELLTTTLQLIAERLTRGLEGALPEGARLPFAELLSLLSEAMSSPALQPYMNVWLELAAGASREMQPHRRIAGEIADGFIAWMISHLAEPPAEAEGKAALLLATIDGFMLLGAIGRSNLATAGAAAAIG
jgi:AcrR family transcriptional regulator